MKKPSINQRESYEHSREFNEIFRSVDNALEAQCTVEERVVVMTTIWPSITAIVSRVVKRTIDDMTGVRRT